MSLGALSPKEVARMKTRVNLSVGAWTPLLALFLFAIALRKFLAANTDVSWGITMAEKVLDGAQLYVDVIEVNPPATVFLYLVPVALARGLLLRPEVVVDAFVFAAAALSLWFSAQVILRAKIVTCEALPKLAALFAAVLLILPAQTFAEREHIAVILALPSLAVLAVRATGEKPHWHWIPVAGLAAGAMFAIKPHFAAAIAFAALAAAIYAKSWRPLFAPEHFIAAAVGAAYFIFVFFRYPLFFSEMVPLLAAVYLPAKMPLGQLLLFFATPLFVVALAMLLVLRGREVLRFPYGLLLAACFGFSLSYYVQQKGWAYHSYPMLAFVLLTLALAFAGRWPFARNQTGRARFARLASAAGVALLFGATFLWMNFAVDMRALEAPIRQAGSRPAMLVIGADLAVGHPLTRTVNGTWASRVSAQWMTAGAMIRKHEGVSPEIAVALDRLIDRDRKMLVEDIRRAKPDIVLVDRIRFDWLKWAEADPALARELSNYRPLETVNGVLILRR